MDSRRATDDPIGPTRDDNSSTGGAEHGRSVEGPYRDFHDALEARRRALKRTRDEALGAAAAAEEELRQLSQLDRARPRSAGRARRMLVGGAMLLAIAAPTFAAGYAVAGAAGAAARREDGHPKTSVAAQPVAARVGAGQRVRPVGATIWEVDEALVDHFLETQPVLGRPVRIIPHEESGRITGVKLYGVRRGSVLAALGFENGDLVQRVDGIEISSPDAALEAYSRIRRRDAHDVELVRRGERLHHIYLIR